MLNNQEIIESSLQSKLIIADDQQSLTKTAIPSIQPTKEINMKYFINAVVNQAKDTSNKLNCEGRFRLEYTDLGEMDLKSILNHVIILLESAWKEAHKDHTTLESTKEKNKKLIEFQNWCFKQINTKEQFEPISLFFKKFEAVVKNNADNDALIFDSGRWTYQQLNEKANQIAHGLIKLKANNNWPDESRIALFFENSPEAVALILAVMKAGLAYVPLTNHHQLPIERLAHYLLNSDAKMLIVQDKFDASNNEFINTIKNRKEFGHLIINSFQQILNIDKNKNNPNISVHPDQLAYILYSSGSTGKPKGIKCAHRGLLAPVEAVKEKFDLKPTDKIGWHSLLTFDASLLDIMTPLANGLALVIIPQHIRTDSNELERYMDAKEISIITLVPSVIDILHPEKLEKLRGYLSVGERARKYHFDNFYTTGRLPHDPPRIGINGFGHTEASMCTSLGVHIPNEELHIGSQPVSGLEWYVLSLPTEECPYPLNPKFVTENQPGELYLAGNNLALGYVDTTADYQQRFRAIPHPDLKHADKMLWVYQTGDKVQWTKDKKLLFLDRVDNQCKFLGELIHPAEIENSIINYQDNKIFKNAQVIVEGYDEPKNDPKELNVSTKSSHALPVLHAYLELDPAIIANEKLIREVHFNLKNFHYIVPSRFSFISQEEWPKVQSDKIDRKALAKCNFKIFYIDPVFKIEPKDEIEKTIANIWYDILQIPRNELTLTLEHNLYDLGGRSIHTSEMLTKINQIYDHYNIDLAQFNACPTIRALAFRVRNSSTDLKCNHVVKWYHGEATFKQNLNSNRPPIILINAVTGDATKDYQNIISCWLEQMSDWPLLYTQALSLKNPGYIIHSLNQLANDYIQSIMADNLLKNYNGPLILIGYSAGGTLAYEIARQLKKLNRPTAVLLIDSESTHYYNTLSQEAYAKEIHDLMFHMSKVMKIDPDDMRKIITTAELQKFPRKKQLALFWQRFMEQHDNISKEEQEKYLGCYATYHNFSQCLFDYKPEPVDYATLLSFSETRNKCNDDRLGWDKCLNLKEVKILGKHLSVVDDIYWVKKYIMPQIASFCSNAQDYLKHQVIRLPFRQIINELTQLYRSQSCAVIRHPLDETCKIPFDIGYIHLILTKIENIKDKQILNEQKEFSREAGLRAWASIYTQAEKSDINLKGLLNPNKTQQKIIISGQAGIGKSTFLQYLRLLSTNTISSENRPAWYDNYDLVIFVPLQLLQEYNPIYPDKLDDPRELAHFIFYAIKLEFGEQITAILNEEKLNELLLALKNNILFLLDSADEILTLLSNQHKLSPLANILLRQPNVILATRSITLPLNIIYSDAHFELMGFDNTNIENYVSIYLKQQDLEKKKDELLISLKENIARWTIAHIPFNLAVLCMILTDSNNNQQYNISTITEEYQYLIKFLQKRYQEKKHIGITYSLDPEQALEVLTFRPMFVLEELANNSMMHQQRIIPSATLKSILKRYNTTIQEQSSFIASIHDMGLLRWYGNKIYQVENDAYFVHLTFAEFLTARFYKHIFNHSPQATDYIQETLKLNKFNPCYRMVWCYLAGLLTNNQDHLQIFFDLLFEEPREAVGPHEYLLFMMCLEQTKLQFKIKQQDEILNKIASYMIFCLMIFDESITPVIEFENIFIDAIKICPIIFNKIFNTKSFQTAVINILSMKKDNYLRFLSKIINHYPSITQFLLQQLHPNPTHTGTNRKNKKIANLLFYIDTQDAYIIDTLLKKWILYVSPHHYLKDLSKFPSITYDQKSLGRFKEIIQNCLTHFCKLQKITLDFLLEPLFDNPTLNIAAFVSNFHTQRFAPTTQHLHKRLFYIYDNHFNLIVTVIPETDSQDEIERLILESLDNFDNYEDEIINEITKRLCQFELATEKTINFLIDIPDNNSGPYAFNRACYTVNVLTNNKPEFIPFLVEHLKDKSKFWKCRAVAAKCLLDHENLPSEVIELIIPIICESEKNDWLKEMCVYLIMKFDYCSEDSVNLLLASLINSKPDNQDILIAVIGKIAKMLVPYPIVLSTIIKHLCNIIDKNIQNKIYYTKLMHETTKALGCLYCYAIEFDKIQIIKRFILISLPLPIFKYKELTEDEIRFLPVLVTAVSNIDIHTLTYNKLKRLIFLSILSCKNIVSLSNDEVNIFTKNGYIKNKILPPSNKEIPFKELINSIKLTSNLLFMTMTQIAYGANKLDPTNDKPLNINSEIIHLSPLFTPIVSMSMFYNAKEIIPVDALYSFIRTLNSTCNMSIHYDTCSKFINLAFNEFDLRVTSYAYSAEQLQNNEQYLKKLNHSTPHNFSMCLLHFVNLQDKTLNDEFSRLKESVSRNIPNEFNSLPLIIIGYLGNKDIELDDSHHDYYCKIFETHGAIAYFYLQSNDPHIINDIFVNSTLIALQYHNVWGKLSSDKIPPVTLSSTCRWIKPHPSKSYFRTSLNSFARLTSSLYNISSSMVSWLTAPEGAPSQSIKVDSNKILCPNTPQLNILQNLPHTTIPEQNEITRLKDEAARLKSEIAKSNKLIKECEDKIQNKVETIQSTDNNILELQRKIDTSKKLNAEIKLTEKHSEENLKKVKISGTIPASLQEYIKIFHEDLLLSNISSIKNDTWATALGIENTLNLILGDVAHIVQPSLSSIFSPFDNDESKAKQAFINYSKAIFGYYDQTNTHQKNGFVAEDGGTLLKPVVMIMNTASVKAKSATDSHAIGGSHWVTCVILPKKYKILNTEFNFDSEKIYFIDSFYDRELPQKFVDYLTVGDIYQEEISPGFKEDNQEHKIITRITHKIESTFPKAVIINLKNIPQQMGGEDCGYWAVYNAMMIITTGSNVYTQNFKEPRSRNFAYKLRYLFPKLDCEDNLQNNTCIKESAKHMLFKPPPQLILSDEQIARNIAITKLEIDQTNKRINNS